MAHNKKDLTGGVTQAVTRLAEPLAQQLGLRLWDVRFVKEGVDWFLRVTIDKDGPVDMDDCVRMTRLLDPALDAADPIPHSYCLEVCSPGVERELSRPEHFQQFIGAVVRVTLYAPRDGSRELIGLLQDFSEEGLTLLGEDGNTFLLKAEETARVHTVDTGEEP